MECNRDEATRAKEISEKHFLAKDFLGAKKFALKAQSLYPSLDGIQHMLTTLNVYISYEKRVNGEPDLYEILEVSPQADEDTIRKQYRKLALMLHPDKNKSIGADGAFKLISEAWSLLSDKSKRMTYDQKRNINVHKQKVTPPPRSNGVNNFNKSTKAKAGSDGVHKSKKSKKAREQKGTSNKNTTTNGTASSNQPQKYPSTPTFWTVCHRCRLQHEYLRMYLHRNLLCPGCDLPYYAFETPPPSTNVPQTSSVRSNNFQQSQNGDHMGPIKTETKMGFNDLGSSNHSDSHQGLFSSSKTAYAPNQPTPASEQACEKGKGAKENPQTSSGENETDWRMKNCGSKEETVPTLDSDAVKRRKVAEDQTNILDDDQKTMEKEAKNVVENLGNGLADM